MRDPENQSPTQSALILEALQERAGQWVPMPELVRRSGAYAVHSRVSELRSRGHDIDVRIKGGRLRRSFYRLRPIISRSLNENGSPLRDPAEDGNSL